MTHAVLVDNAALTCDCCAGCVWGHDAELGGSGGNGTRRRLSEQEHNLRRMVREFHNTERSLKEFVELQNLLRDVHETHVEQERRRLVGLGALLGTVGAAGGTQSLVKTTPKAKKTTRTGAGGAKVRLGVSGWNRLSRMQRR
jgi:hypothetical protein